MFSSFRLSSVYYGQRRRVSLVVLRKILFCQRRSSGQFFTCCIGRWQTILPCHIPPRWLRCRLSTSQPMVRMLINHRPLSVLERALCSFFTAARSANNCNADRGYILTDPKKRQLHIVNRFLKSPVTRQHRSSHITIYSKSMARAEHWVCVYGTTVIVDRRFKF